MDKKIKIAIAGLGNRGRWCYAENLKHFPDYAEIVAIADIIPERVAEAKKTFNIPDNMCFSSAEEMIQKDKLADAMFICTQDRDHYKQSIPAMEKGYDLLLEKPVSPILNELTEIYEVSKKYNRKVVVCHVLRYTPFYQKLKSIIDEGTIGEIITIQAIENVGYYHQAHSFVRGNWNNSNVTSPMILQKTCHDMDIFLWLSGKTCKRVSSYGDLTYFKKENAPEGSALRCLNGCKVKDSCPYDAEKIYMTSETTGILTGHNAWPNNVLALCPTKESVYEAIKVGPYGRCVFHCDNNVVDHQVVNLEMFDKTTVNFTMSGFTSANSRQIKIMGTNGDITGDMGENTIEVNPFGKDLEFIDVSTLSDDFSGHGGGDKLLVKDFLELLSDDPSGAVGLTSIDKSLESHYIALAAEESRLNNGESIEIKDFIKI